MVEKKSNEITKKKTLLRFFLFTFQTIPRTVLFDKKTRTNLLLWPIEEVESLRLSSDEYEGVVVKPGSIVPLNISQATQVCL